MTSRLEDVAWAAGLFEGEGCFTSRLSYGRRRTPVCSLNMTDEGPVRMFADIIGIGKVYGPYAYRGNKPFWRWQTHGPGPMLSVLTVLWPWLGERRINRAEEILRAKEAEDMPDA